jgi:ABC-2 type transport system ATP-binding protein
MKNFVNFMNAIEIIDLSKRYKDFHLEKVNMNIPQGTIVGLIGRNGAGKSTLIKCVLGLVNKDCGQVLIPAANGKDIHNLIGYVPEELIFYEWMKVGRLINFVSAYYRSWDHSYCEKLLMKYELDSNKQIKHLSKGMKVKLALVLALAHKPSVLLLDEPTSGLDPFMKHSLLQELRRVVNTGIIKAVLISSHILSEVEQIVDYIAVLRSGSLVVYEDKSSLMAKWKKVTFSPTGKFKLPPSHANGIHVLGDGRYMMLVRGYEPNFLNLLAQYGAKDIQVTEPTLQEIFLQIA